jgi:hypothetical protein
LQDKAFNRNKNVACMAMQKFIKRRETSHSCMKLVRAQNIELLSLEILDTPGLVYTHLDTSRLF